MQMKPQSQRGWVTYPGAFNWQARISIRKLNSILCFVNHYTVQLKLLPELQVRMSNILFDILTCMSNGHLKLYILKRLLNSHPILPRAHLSFLMVFSMWLNGDEIHLGHPGQKPTALPRLFSPSQVIRQQAP